MPRTVTLNSNRGPIEIVYVTGRDANHSSFIDFHFMVFLNCILIFGGFGIS
uniref:Uncharacterized protein n=1 Tax=Meloidogyne incognita TaxID=6306 RepID=A0A914MMC3_MELIC